MYRRGSLFLGLLWHIMQSPMFLTLLGASLGIATYSAVFEHSVVSAPCKVAVLEAVGAQRTIVQLGGKPAPSHTTTSQPKNLKLTSSEIFFKGLPEEYKRTYFAPCGKNCHAMIRALRNLGWQKVNHIEEARMVYTHDHNTTIYSELYPWQRYSHLPHVATWGEKNNFVLGWKEYAKEHGWPQFLPEAYSLSDEVDRTALNDRMLNGGGLKEHWIMIKSGESYEDETTSVYFPASSKALQSIFKSGIQSKTEVEDADDWIIQRYICNPVVHKYKVVIRSYFLVASLDPLLVFYMDGDARSVKHEDTIFKPKKEKLTYTMQTLEDDVLLPLLKKKKPLLKQLNQQYSMERPLDHVRNQIKAAIATLVDAFQEKAFTLADPLMGEDGFAFYSVDFTLDDDLNVWMHSAHGGSPALSEDHYFQLELNHNFMDGTVRILSEIWDKQAKGLPILPLKDITNTQWEMVYAANGGETNGSSQYKYTYYKGNTADGGAPYGKMTNKCHIDATSFEKFYRTANPINTETVAVRNMDEETSDDQ